MDPQEMHGANEIFRRSLDQARDLAMQAVQGGLNPYDIVVICLSLENRRYLELADLLVTHQGFTYENNRDAMNPPRVIGVLSQDLVARIFGKISPEAVELLNDQPNSHEVLTLSFGYKEVGARHIIVKENAKGFRSELIEGPQEFD